MPFFSVVIPLYNRANRITSTIQSVLDQSYQDFEIVIVDDGSSDDPEPVITALGDSRIRLIRQPNGGANRARNHGIDEAVGTYVALLDSDDHFLPHHLAAAKAVVDVSPNTVVYAKVKVDRGGGVQFLKPPRALRAGEHMAEYVLCDRGFVQTSTVVVERSLAASVRYLDGHPFGQDTDFAIRLFNAGAKFVMLEEPGAVWLDEADVKRVSSRSSATVRLNWLESMKEQMPRKAYLGDRGWFVAKALAREGKRALALQYYLAAVLNGCYPPKVAAAVFLQVAMPNSAYRKAADIYLKVRGISRGAQRPDSASELK